jgi:hypothetical protein
MTFFFDLSSYGMIKPLFIVIDKIKESDNHKYIMQVCNSFLFNYLIQRWYIWVYNFWKKKNYLVLGVDVACRSRLMFRAHGLV